MREEQDQSSALNSQSIRDDPYTERFDDDDEEFHSQIMKMTAKQNLRVRTWRYAVTSMLLMTIAFSMTTYVFLDREEKESFRTAFAQFSRALGDSAFRQKQTLKDSLEALANAITMNAQKNNADWPFFYLEGYEKYAGDFLKLSRAELIAVDNVVSVEQLEEYLSFVTTYHQEWIEESHRLKYGNLNNLDPDPSKYNPFLTKRTEEGFVADEEREVNFARIAFSPPLRAYGPMINWNIASGSHESRYASLQELKNETLVSSVRHLTILDNAEPEGHHENSDETNSPHSFVSRTILKDAENPNSEVVAFVTAAIAWDASMRNLLPDNVKGIYCVIQNSCNQSFTYEIDGKESAFRGEGDQHDPKYNDMEVYVDLSLSTHPDAQGNCEHRLHIYPSDRFAVDYESMLPEIFASVVAAAFGLAALFFLVYDTMVQIRNNEIVTTAARSNQILSSLFPGSIRDRVLEQQATARRERNPLKRHASNLISYLRDDSESDDEGQGNYDEAQPLAELFPDATVFFADIAGFTAWASVREPTQVFLLLESLYSSFDSIAKQHRVFKVETVGDCYMAVTGIHPKRSDHAVLMARFARDCMHKMQTLTKELEVTLGPDTGDLILRIGMHSGPVTAGVLRGEKARFQLFGDTVNTASRMESTGQPGRIQLSSETAKLLASAGKESWFNRRDDKITAKGKGEMQTYWLRQSGADTSSRSADPSTGRIARDVDVSDDEPIASVIEISPPQLKDAKTTEVDERTNRLIEWNVEMLARLLRPIIARRESMVATDSNSSDNHWTRHSNCSIPFDEVKEIIRLPEFDINASITRNESDKDVIPSNVAEELHDYVSCVASLYRPNPFHNFAHASHVTMSVIKLMSRIVSTAPGTSSRMDETGTESCSDEKTNNEAPKQISAARIRHEKSYGITSDPLTQFACAFSALIHDVDHQGVSNQQLMKENAGLKIVFKGRSVAEQHSFDVCWSLLMEDRFAGLRSAICASGDELARFRQLVINSVMATDLLDADLKALRNARWDRAFTSTLAVELPASSTKQTHAQTTPSREEKNRAMNRKATIVIEHLIQASDVAHTMQHWQVYRKWNERLFEELYDAYRAGRSSGGDPSLFWYEGELRFFDFYIIPLAKKLKDCGVFGVSSDEYLNYATNNRNEWESRGRGIVEEMVKHVRRVEC